MAAPIEDVVKVATAYQVAIAKLSAAAALLGLRHWFALSRHRSKELVPVVSGQVDRGLALGAAFYRLYRALAVGRTSPDLLREGAPAVVPLRVLVKDFEAVSGQKVRLISPGSLRVPVEPVDVSAGLLGEVKRGELVRARRLVDGRKPVTDGGSLEVFSAGVVQQAAANGARQLVAAQASRDRRVAGWMRVSTTGSPCAFCSMLISRGAAYGSKESADSAERFHPNCKCVAIPTYRGVPVPPGFDKQHKFYEAEWKALSARLGRSPTLSDWRSEHYRKHKR